MYFKEPARALLAAAYVEVLFDLRNIYPPLPERVARKTEFTWLRPKPCARDKGAGLRSSITCTLVIASRGTHRQSENDESHVTLAR